jgi:hypothetical protein
MAAIIRLAPSDASRQRALRDRFQDKRICLGIASAQLSHRCFDAWGEFSDDSVEELL